MADDTQEETSNEWVPLDDDDERLIRAYIRRVTTDPDDCEELTQATHVVLWERQDTHSTLSTRGRVILACREACRAWVRTRRQHAYARDAFAVVTDLWTPPSFEDIPLLISDEDDLWDAVRDLPPRQRLALLHRVLWSHSVQ